MKVIKAEQVVGCDIDGTLIQLGDIEPNDPAAIDMIDPFNGQNMRIKPRQQTINLVKRMYVRGIHIIFWSQQGPMWAEAVVKQLGLENDNALVIAKPMAHIDDLPCVEWMGNRIHLKEKWEK